MNADRYYCIIMIDQLSYLNEWSNNHQAAVIMIGDGADQQGQRNISSVEVRQRTQVRGSEWQQGGDVTDRLE